MRTQPLLLILAAVILVLSVLVITSQTTHFSTNNSPGDQAAEPASTLAGAAPANKCVQVNLGAESISYRNTCSFTIWFSSRYETTAGQAKFHSGALKPLSEISLSAPEVSAAMSVTLGAYRNTDPNDDRLDNASPAYQASVNWASNLKS